MNKYPEKVKLAVVNRYLNGIPISKISHDTNISRTTVYAWLKQHNTTFNKGKAPNFRYLHDLQQKTRYLSVHPTALSHHYQKDTK